MDGKSLDLVAEKLAKLRAIFPEAFSEELLDIEKLQQVVGQKATNGNERYSISWAGKGDAFRVLQEPTTATLVPAREESINFDETGHIFIEGENLEVLKVLQKAYYGKVKMIYIDPPYNTGSDSFIYPDRFAESKEEYLKRIADKDETGLLLKEGLFRKNSKENGQYHSNWLSMMYPRLYLARNMLRDDGVIFVSIDDNEVHNLRLIMNEVFGEENFLTALIWKRRQNVDSRSKTGVSQDHEYVVCYGRSEASRFRGGEKDMSKYSNPDNDPRGEWMSDNMVGLATIEQRPNLHYDLVHPTTGIVYKCPPTGWRYEKSRMYDLITRDEVIFPKTPDGRPRRKKFSKDLESEYTGFTTIIDDTFNTQATREVRELFSGQDVFDFPKPVQLMKQLISQALNDDNGSIILDFFAGSGTTAHAVYELNFNHNLNNRVISVQLPEKTEEKSAAFQAGYKSIAEVSKERIRKVIAELKQKATQNNLFSSESTPDFGFKVFKLRESNFRTWRGDLAETEAELTEQLDMFVETLRPEAQEENVAYELLLKSGFELTTPLKRQAQGEAYYWSVNDGEVLLLLSSIDEDLIGAVIASRPHKVICLDSLFHGDDQLKTNTALAMKDAGIPFEVV